MAARTLFGIALVLACGLSACREPAWPSREAQRVRLPDGSWLQVEGSEQMGARWSHRQGRQARALPDPPVALFPVELLPSPDGRYLAVLSVGEGHPVLEIFDLARFLKGTHGEGPLRSIDPYPGIIDMDGWEGVCLRVQSDRPLAACCGPSGRVPGEEVSEQMLPFLLDAETGAIRPE